MSSEELTVNKGELLERIAGDVSTGSSSGSIGYATTTTPVASRPCYDFTQSDSDNVLHAERLE